MPDWLDWNPKPDWTDWGLGDGPGHDGVYVQVHFPLVGLNDAGGLANVI